MSQRGSPLPGWERSRGFTLLELSICLAVIGLISVLLSGAYGSATSATQQRHAQVRADAVGEAVKAFALSRGRLPCPDAAGNGWESLDASGICASALVMGHVPYLSLGLTRPANRDRGLYGVYRSADIDLVAPGERTADGGDSPRWHDLGDLLRALQAASALPPSKQLPYLTGNDQQAGAVNCEGNLRSNPAFVVVLPGDGRTDASFESPHADLLGAGRCIAAPGRAAHATFNDAVAAESLHALLGWLARYNTY